DAVAVAFLLLAIPFLNLRKDADEWVKARTVPAALYGIPAGWWFDAAYAVLAAVVIAALLRHLRHPLPIIPATWYGKGQLLYLVFLWWVVVGNFERAIVAFAPQRLVTEGVIHLNAALCTALALLAPLLAPSLPAKSPELSGSIRRVVSLGLA